MRQMKNGRRGRAILVAATFAAMTASSVRGDSFTWTGGGGDGAWSNPANWTNTTPGGVALFPGASDSVTFNINATTTNGSAANFTNTAIFQIAPGSIYLGGTVNNTGVIQSDSSGGASFLYYPNSQTTTLSGGGSVLLNKTNAIIPNNG